MKRSRAIFLQALIVVLGIGVLTFLLWEPWVEGINVGATFSQVYFDDAFLAFAYIASIPFFVALYQAFKLLGYARHDAFFSSGSAKSLRTIKYCAISSIGFVIVGLVWLLQMESDDRPPLIGMATVAVLISIAVAKTASKFEKKILQNVANT